MKIKTLFRWHQWLGLFTGIFLILIGGSGSVAVFIEEIDWLATPALRANAASGQPRASVDALVSTIRASYPADRLLAINLSNRPSFAHVARVASKTRGRLDVFLDPVTAEVKGERVISGAYTSTLRNFIRQFHVRLLMGIWGRVFAGFLGAALVLSCVTGLWIYRGWLRDLLRLRWRAASARIRWSNLHKIIGVCSLVFNIMVGITGAVYGYENLAVQIHSHWLRPAPAKTAAGVITQKAAAPRRPAGNPLPLGIILERAHHAFPDLTVHDILLPSKPAAPVLLKGNVPGLFVQQSHVRRASLVAIDQYTGEVLRKVDGRDATGWARVYSAFDPLHFGYFGGLATKIIWAVLGLTPGALALSGAWLWWKRMGGRSSQHQPNAVIQPSIRRWARPVVLIVVALVLLGAYVIAARARGTWAFNGKIIEHALAKPVTLALTFFPVTGLLVWLARRSMGNRLKLSVATCVLCAWYLFLVTLFQ